MSRAEQAGVGTRDDDGAAALVEGNLAYERAVRPGLPDPRGGPLGDRDPRRAHRATRHTDAEEQPIVAEQLRQIAVLRLKGLFA